MPSNIHQISCHQFHDHLERTEVKSIRVFMKWLRTWKNNMKYSKLRRVRHHSVRPIIYLNENNELFSSRLWIRKNQYWMNHSLLFTHIHPWTNMDAEFNIYCVLTVNHPFSMRLTQYYSVLFLIGFILFGVVTDHPKMTIWYLVPVCHGECEENLFINEYFENANIKQDNSNALPLLWQRPNSIAWKTSLDIPRAYI